MLPAWSAGHWLAVLVLGMTGVAAFGLAPSSAEEAVPVKRILRDLPNPVRAADDADDAVADTLAPEHYWREERIRRGDTLGSVLARLGVDDPEALTFVRLDP